MSRQKLFKKLLAELIDERKAELKKVELPDPKEMQFELEEDEMNKLINEAFLGE